MSARRVQTVLAWFAIVLVASDGWTQEATPQGRKNSLEPGSWSIQFQIEDDIGLKPFDGLILSLKQHWTSHSAFRFGIDMDLSYSDTDDDYRSVSNDSTANGSMRSGTSNGQALQLDLIYMNYPNPGLAVNFFWGAGPLMYLSRSKVETESESTSPSSTIRDIQEDSAHSWRAGVLGAAGVEWFATKGISFHAEYRASLAYGRSKTEGFRSNDQGLLSTSTSERTFWVFDAVKVILGLSVYF